VDYIIETNNLTKKFGSNTVVNNLNIKVERGSIHGFLGPNGAGKSTTIKMLVGLLKPTAGDIKIFGVHSSKVKVEMRQKIGFMSGLPQFPKHLKAQELMEIYGGMYGFSKDFLSHQIPILFKMVGLSGREKDKIGTYSKGMVQRLGIAQALLGDPEIIILDEPANGVDPVGMVKVRDLIKLIASKGKTIFLSSHLLDEIQKVCTHVTIINKGVALASGSINDVIENLTEKPGLVLEIANLNKVVLSSVKNLPFVENIKNIDNQKISITVKESQNRRKEISQTITKAGGIIIQMTPTNGKDLEKAFIKLITKSGEEL